MVKNNNKEKVFTGIINEQYYSSFDKFNIFVMTNFYMNIKEKL